MIKFFYKPYRWAKTLTLLLTLSFAFVLLDSFVIPKAQMQVPPGASSQPTTNPPPISLVTIEDNQDSGADFQEATPQTESGQGSPMEPVITENTYQDDNIAITVETARAHDTTFYVADIQISDPDYLRTALAQDTFGRNIKQSTSQMAADHDAIFAVNGDYYGFRDSGFVLRNGVLYRDSGENDALVIDGDGSMSVINEKTANAHALLAAGAWQVFSFGPGLVEDGVTAVDGSSEVTKSMRSNPRTAIGQVSALHYIVIVSDGRTGESQGLSLLELAEEFANQGCTVAYNLDGGGSSTMVLNGVVINNPTSGRSVKEREVSDIVYIGYQ